LYAEEVRFAANLTSRPVVDAFSTPADIISKSLRVERVVSEKVEMFALYLAATAAVELPHVQFDINPRVATRQISHPVQLAIVPAHLGSAATAANRFFERRGA
jgi:hypothetical protein